MQERVGTKERYNRPLPEDKKDERASKTLSWVLRHHAIDQGLPMRKDGYVKVSDLLNVPKLHSVDFTALERIVRNDKKSRYKMISELDEGGGQVWWIRANQGHSIKGIEIEMQEITDPSQVIMAVHGTSKKAWEIIRMDGLSRMNRQHIHFAQGVPKSGVISGMRDTSQILIYLDIEAALKYGIKLLLSANDVVLSPGDANGYIPPCFFKDVQDAGGKQRIYNWTRPDLPPLPEVPLSLPDPPVTNVIESKEADKEEAPTASSSSSS